MNKLLKYFAASFGLLEKLNNAHVRREWVAKNLSAIPDKSKLLDAGCGTQQYRDLCAHLEYRGQDFGQYIIDEKKMLGAEDGGLGSGEAGFIYGELDYRGDVWDIDETNEFFDAILCTEVFEHIPYPNKAIREFGRLLKSDGVLLVTAPSNCLRHMDPYFYYSGFSDRWYETVLAENGFRIDEIVPVGDYNSWLSVELARSIKSAGIIGKILMMPAFLFFIGQKKSQLTTDTLCMGYMVKARKV